MKSSKLERSRMRRKVSRTVLKSSEEGRPSSLIQQYADETTEEDLRKIAEKAPIIKLAYDELDRFSWNEKDLVAYEERIMDLRKEEGILAKKLDEGKIEVAKNLLKADISIDIISQTTGLPQAEIKRLQEEIT
ncbi:hypothetical protein R0F62_06485 [Wolbachia endosymbiont of Drosophila aff. chauvacae BK-2020]|uniref:hypothetical protein n=1 Tax=unclassified Wolbachia TaxID=2640676 RepID=UPI0023A9FA69|nr:MULTISPECIES: hypothetical protein [unclassified Wolbachia]MDE5060294.1 hypothetical protein [Wolbachia endosymbiont of Drosophila burlai]MDE5064367.1 hypothetical protein [Wolbachia endosymbiont of Drosophila tristis]MDU8920006.1 hypothetical protein [Wolbachia endosymbiont of Drosophila tristis]WOE62746.1 hypothetical protein R0F62_06485 [Wolbachia endosymbiont of Drosophila aff. chauvacae BK-2020]